MLSSGTLFVDAGALGIATGETWLDAFPTLQAALDGAGDLNGDADTANDVTAVWLAAGTYRPTKPSVAAEARTATFQLLSGVSLYGGFAGSESSLDQRERDSNGVWRHPTILSGDLLGNDAPGDDSTFTDDADGRYSLLLAAGQHYWFEASDKLRTLSFEPFERTVSHEASGR